MADLIKIKIGGRKVFVGIIGVPADNFLWERTFDWMLDEVLKSEIIKDEDIVEFRICSGGKSIYRIVEGREGNATNIEKGIFYKMIFVNMFNEVILARGD